MNKEQLLNELSLKINTSEISREEIANRFSLVSKTEQTNTTNIKNTSPFSVTKILYILGVAIVIIGIIIFMAQIWDDITSTLRILVTLGLGLIITMVGSLLLKQKPTDAIGPIFHFIGGMLIPGGAMVALYELEIDFVSLWPVIITFGIIFLFYLLLNIYHKHPVLTFFTIANGTTFIYLLVGQMINDSNLDYSSYEDVYAYLTMIIGASYLLLAQYFRNNWNKYLTGVLYFFGSGAFLGAAFSQVFDNTLWQTLYFLIIIAGLFLSVYMKSSIILTMSTIFLIAHVSYITSEYFADSIGWPVSLVILGFIFIALGYTSISISNKYIKTPQKSS